MHRIVAVLLASFIAPFAFAGMPTLTVQSDDGSVALELSAVAIHTTVRGHLARTEFSLTYRNSLDRVVGGDFHFPLPPDAEVSDLGLWFDGKLRHGVAVERVKARQAYEEIVHRSVDPALAEWGAGRAFRLSIFPIPAKGEKQVFIAYDQELTNADYTLDLRFGTKIDKFELTVDAGDLAVRSEGSVRMQSRGEVVDGMVTIARDPRETAFVARSYEDGHWYASAAIDVDVPPREATPASHVVILYDISSSAIQHDAALLRRFLTEFLARQQAWGTADLIPFHLQLDEPRRIEMIGTPAGARELERALDALQPLGATNLLAVAERLPKIAAGLHPATRIVLVTDGLATLGDSRAVAAAFAKLGNIGRPLLVVHASSSPNDHLIANAARTTGGWAVDLKTTGVDEAIRATQRIPTSLALDSRLTLSRLLMASPGRSVIAAESRDPINDLGALKVVLRELHGVTEGEMVRRAYARAKLREILAGNASDDDLIAHGRAFTQLTPRTSLLVLERWSDYVEFDIPMPPDVLAQKQCNDEEWAWQLANPRPFRPAPPPPPATVVHDGWQLRGRILDDEGSPLPGVTVVLRDGAAIAAVAVTNADGSYLLGAATMPQTPRVEAMLEGFGRTARQIGNDTPSGQSVDMTLTVTSVSEAITVTAQGPVVDTTFTTMASTLRSTSRDSISTDQLLSAIFENAGPVSDDPEVLAAVTKRRRELTQGVVDKLRGIGSTEERLRYYTSARTLLGGDKTFHVFAAEALRERSPELAVRVLTDLAEEHNGDAALLRILARVLDAWGETTLARLLLERALEAEPDQPQTWRELVLLEARHGRTSSVGSWWRRMVATRQDDWESDDVHQQTAKAVARWDQASPGDRRSGLDLRVDEGDDLTIELMFDTGWCWVDLHVIEPGGEDVSWNHETSAAGATFTGGYTFGFGPEIYRIAKAPRGEYRLEVDYFSDDTTTIGTEALVHVVVYQRGRRGMQRSDHFIVLKTAEERQVLTTVRVE
jgi:Flp pilus assembly protein TadD